MYILRLPNPPRLRARPWERLRAAPGPRTRSRSNSSLCTASGPSAGDTASAARPIGHGAAAGRCRQRPVVSHRERFVSGRRHTARPRRQLDKQRDIGG